MAITVRTVPLPRAALWAAVCAGDRYGDWVVGTNRIRHSEPGFPAPGTSVHYRLGHAPLAKDGATRVLSRDEGRALELEAQGWPVGRVFIGLVLDGRPDGPTCVSIEEHPSAGPWRWVHNPLLDAAVQRRNRTTLARLESLALELHGTGGAGHGPGAAQEPSGG